MSDATASSSNSSFTATLVAVVGGFAIFLLILLVAYLPNKAAPAGDGVRTPEQRKAALAELRGKEKTTATTYGWVDKEAGVVRIPVAQAKELIIRENSK
jgi:lysylphosphatidylglycerol synthetase-like protein (DUF2156 family)